MVIHEGSTPCIIWKTMVRSDEVTLISDMKSTFPVSNPLCYGLPPHNLLPYGTTQPTTSANMVPNSSQQFNVKKEDT
ncbi:hypothetical protein AVEN_200305-1 [Araneus ventricosus]|uniref:Uncharacterized protein n=1 Tax=Araneus ventricosus TaxID=182803 RepID=A0A4Y2QXZ5_ARAVE|nr:hypothetical protein AVEN_200305-1 [Araneus ventricosus]